MEFGKLEYSVGDNGVGRLKRIRLTLVGQGDEDILRAEGIAALRRKRIARLTEEAEAQGVLLSYEELADLLLISLATLKRDVAAMERAGCAIQIRGRRKSGVAGSAVGK